MNEFNNGQRVHIVPIKEDGVVDSTRNDDRGEPIITVMRDSDGKAHLCREMELEPAT